MVVESLVLALIVWFVVISLGVATQCPAAGGILGFIASFFVGVVLMLFSQVLLFTGFLMLVAGISCQVLNIRGLKFAGISFAMIPLAFTTFSCFAWSSVQRQVETQKKYPFVSLEKRLAYETKYLQEPEESAEQNGVFLFSMSPQLQSEAEELVTQVNRHSGYGSLSRATTLSMLHRSQMEAFANSPGFGVSRGMIDYSESDLATEPRPSITPPAAPEVPYAPDSDQPTGELPGDIVQVEEATDENRTVLKQERLKHLHFFSAGNFVNSEGFGLVHSVKQVAGFEPHSFSMLPSLKDMIVEPGSRNSELPEEINSQEDWVIVSLQLVSLLKHDKPLVYATKELPRMQILSSEDVPTRELNPFEAEALPKLAKGETLMVKESTNRIQMLGAVRAGDTCIRCHQVPKLTLLGAFSYELARAQPVPEKPARPAEGPEL